MRSIATLLLFISIYACGQTHRNLVIEGGGIRGIAYSGALEALDSAGALDSIEQIAATSSGAIVGFLFAIGYEPKEISDIMLNTDIHKFNQVGVPLFGGIHRMKHAYGYYSTSRFTKAMEDLIRKRNLNPNLCFSDLCSMADSSFRFKKLYITGTSLNRQCAVIFSHETYPRMRVVDALRISISIPLYFEAVFIDQQGLVHDRTCEDCDIMVDGGMLNNYPVHLFDTLYRDSAGEWVCRANPHTLGLKLERTGQLGHGLQLAPYSIMDIGDFIGATYNIGFENLNLDHLNAEHLEHTVIINNLDLNPRVRRIPKKEKEMLIESGRQGARAYLLAKN